MRGLAKVAVKITQSLSLFDDVPAPTPKTAPTAQPIAHIEPVAPPVPTPPLVAPTPTRRLVSAPQLAEELGITKEAVYNHVRRKKIAWADEAMRLLDADVCRQQVAAVRIATARQDRMTARGTDAPPAPQQPPSTPPPTTSESALQAANEDLAVARARKTAADAEAAEVRLAKLRGELVERAQVDRYVGAMFRATQSLMLALPDRLGPVLASITDPVHAITLLRTELERALHTAADELPGMDVDDGQ